jgi:hypothetical protein
MPFKVYANYRHRIPKQRHRITGWSEYDAGLQQRGSLTVWFTEEAVSAWEAEPRVTPGGQPLYSALAITTALTLRAVFRLAPHQTEGLIGFILDWAVPDHSTLSRRAETLEMPKPVPGASGEPVHLLMNSTGLKLCGSGDGVVEKHGTRTHQGWSKLHFGTDADTGRIVASVLTDHDTDDGSQVGPLLDQIAGPVASFTADGAFDREDVYAGVVQRHPAADVIVPPRSSAVRSEAAKTAPTRRDRYIEVIADQGRMNWQKASGYNHRALVEATCLAGSG